MAFVCSAFIRILFLNSTYTTSAADAATTDLLARKGSSVNARSFENDNASNYEAFAACI